jgi:type I restriction enzyme, S subunit
MPKTYTCEKCARIFQRKSGYDDHMNKKNDCSKTTAIVPILEENKELKEEVKEMRLVTQGPVTKETLPAFFENLHNLLWNKSFLSPERALEHMTFFFAYRMMELQADVLQLPDICRWSYVAKLKDENDLCATLDHGTAYFLDNPVTSPFFKQHEIKSAEVVWDIVREINRIPMEVLQETDTLGDIFEYMLSRGMSTMADEGQYYTSRQICSLAFTLAYRIRKTLRRSDGTLCTFGDWFCGTGGFPAEYIRGVNQNLSDIDWKKDSASIYCQDMNMSSVTTTLLNLLIQTGTPFNGVKQTIRTGNSFQQNISQGTGAIHRGLLLDYSFMNPPYGGDKSKGKPYKFAYSVGKGKDKRFLVNSDIQSIGVEDHDKVSAGVQLAMATLAPEGVCCIVLPQGFFFGATVKAVELRKKLAEEYKIHYVVDIASGAFVNTGTKTSMLVFQKGVGPTETIQFIGLDESPLVEATLEQLRQKNYSLNYKQYIAQEVEEVAGFERVRLGDIASDITFGFMIRSEDYGNEGVPVIKTKNIKGKTVHYPASNQKITTTLDERYCVHQGDLLIVLGGSPGENGIWMDAETAWLNQDCAKITIDNEITKKYVFYMLESDIVTSHIQSNITKTTIGHISRGVVRDIPIPLPPLSVQQDIVEAIDGWAQLAHQEEVTLKQLEKQVMSAVKWMGKGQERVRLGDIALFTFGFGIKSEDFGETGLPIVKTKNFRDGLVSLLPSNPRTNKMYDEKYHIRKGDLLMVVDGACGESGIWYENETGWLNQHVAKLTIENETTKMYVAYMMKGAMFREYIQSHIVVTTIPHMQRDVAKNFQIPLPPLHLQQTLQPLFDEIRHKHEKIALYKAMAEQAIKERIPGASSASPSDPAPVQESHSSTCAVESDGTSCTCRITPLLQEPAPEEPEPVASLPASLADSAPKKKIRRPVVANPATKQPEVAE